MAVLTGKSGRVKVTSASYSTAAGEAFTSLSATTDRTEFRITDGTKRHWTRDQPPIILVNSTASTDFTYNPVQGKLTFNTPLTTALSNAVTGTVYWHSASYLPWTREWTADVEVGMYDVTSFSTDGTDVQWRTFQPGLSGATVDLGTFVGDPTTETPQWYDRINTGQDVIVELLQVAGGTTYKWEAYARVESDSWQTVIDGANEESVTLQVDGPLYYATTE